MNQHPQLDTLRHLLTLRDLLGAFGVLCVMAILVFGAAT